MLRRLCGRLSEYFAITKPFLYWLTSQADKSYINLHTQTERKRAKETNQTQNQGSKETTPAQEGTAQETRQKG
jgi:hypothetical protein